jgi:hypothetical protein
MPWWALLLCGLWCVPAVLCVVAFLLMPSIPDPDGEAVAGLTTLLGKLLAAPLLLALFIVLWPCLLFWRLTLKQGEIGALPPRTTPREQLAPSSAS